ASCKLQAASCKLQAASCKLQAASCKSVGAWAGVSSAGWGFSLGVSIVCCGVMLNVFSSTKTKSLSA
ncbi:hypothetical protein, partial [Pseudomonas sp. FSL R10-1350]|uniref:hypothetical protein n=1 Tax=Pseudomonas sp. FSL R10-1350 TaxID=2662197 RepID=UPI001C497CB9